MNKKGLFDAFSQKISKKSIVNRDGEFVIQGKFCVIAYEPPDLWDIWICNPDDLYSGLTQRKVSGIIASLQKSKGWGVFRELTGEADVRVRDKQLILNNLPVLGIKKKQEYSPETLKKMRLRVAEMHKEKKEAA